MSNSVGAEKPSFLLLNSAKNVHIMLKKTDNTISTLHTLMRAKNWNTVKVMHDENKMDLIVNDILTEKWAIGRIQDIDSNLFIGKGKGFDNFTGFIDEIAVFTCRPKFIQI
uniref:Uncharacterized protein LOC111138083 n=1 Tax=Crassostrea virginica TaxID=6565 RepID=A0A8B8EZV5_CRAVI|nr:uncharacterized protein LOC111138083 [Crassostrea virginica]